MKQQQQHLSTIIDHPRWPYRHLPAAPPPHSASSDRVYDPQSQPNRKFREYSTQIAMTLTNSAAPGARLPPKFLAFQKRD
eukprot:1565159-Pleurochrysis_carterae.AAC.1